MSVAEVVVDVPFISHDQVFDYRIPQDLSDNVHIGSRVLVPFGKRRIEGYVIHIKEKSNFDLLKDLVEVLDEIPPLNEELVRLGKSISERYVASLYHTLKMMVPASLRSKYMKVIEWNQGMDDFPLIVLPEEEKVLSYIKSRKIVTMKQLMKQFANAEEVVERFSIKGLLKESMKITDESKPKTEKVVRLLLTKDEIEPFLSTIPAKAQKQRDVLLYMKNNPKLPLKVLLKSTNTSDATIKKLAKLNVVEIVEEVVWRDPNASKTIERDSAKPLTEEQQEVFQKIVGAIQEQRPQNFLLYGVTGSGKTEVYLQVIEEVLKRNRQAIMLVPEISLTPMMVERFRRRFGDQIAVLHSGLSAGEKYDEWRRIRNGEAQVVIGARSAIFAPVRNLGMIIVDEEHETTYKQEEMPRYHIREVAMLRSNLTNCVVVFGSATPSLESYTYAIAGRFTLLQMQQRVNKQVMPQIHLVDMRQEMKDGHRSMFSRILLDKISDRLHKKEQIILLLNRRGYATFVICRSCGYTAQCPHCDISLTYHQTNRTLRCHFCGYTEVLPSLCPKCNSNHIRYFGTGTQRVEEELIKLYPGIRIIRMDMDTTAKKGAHEKLLQAFANQQADILLGTQMIAKGLDFPNVSLVGMISADTTLHLPDFRAAERTFQLITQVAGRAGRHEIMGEVVVQTYTPDHYSIQFASMHDYDRFFHQEIKLRKLGHYPPFYRICMLHFNHEKPTVILKTLGRVVEDLRVALSNESIIYGPISSSIARIKDRYRYHCMIKYKNEPKLPEILKTIIKNYESEIHKQNIQVTIDIDPQYLM